MTTRAKGRNGGDRATLNEADHGGNSNAFGRATDVPAITSDLHRVGGGFSVQFSVCTAGMSVAWFPGLPTPRDLRRKVDVGRYREARNLFLQEFARRTGMKVLCLEAHGDTTCGAEIDGGER